MADVRLSRASRIQSVRLRTPACGPPAAALRALGLQASVQRGAGSGLAVENVVGVLPGATGARRRCS
jgi:hypothetical protein